MFGQYKILPVARKTRPTNKCVAEKNLDHFSHILASLLSACFGNKELNLGSTNKASGYIVMHPYHYWALKLACMLLVSG